MTPEEKIKYWRENLCNDEAVKRQLCEEYANADTLEEIEFLDKIHYLIYINEKQT